MPGMKLPRVHQQRCDLSPLGCPAHAKLVWDISHRDLEPMLNEMTPGARSAVMRYLRAVLFYGIKRGYLRENPIARLDFAGRPRREVETIPVGQIAAILNYVLEHDLGLLPFLVPGFFAGIQPDGELQKVEWRDVDFSDGVVTLRPEVSQTKRRRFPELSANAVAWIRAYVARGGRTSSRIVPFNASQLRAHRTANRSAAGITKWPHQDMLHTYRSNWLALHGDINKFVLQSGHDSVDTMWRNYHRAAKFEHRPNARACSLKPVLDRLYPVLSRSGTGRKVPLITIDNM
jgi:integrase